MAKAVAEADNEKEINALKAKIDSLTAHLDKVYMDKLSGVLDEADFQRIYAKVKADRAALGQRLRQLDRSDFSPTEQADLTKKIDGAVPGDRLRQSGTAGQPHLSPSRFKGQ